MSFILDAIARSEAERKQLEMPGAEVLAFPGNAPPPRRKSWPYLLAVAALILNAVLLYLLVYDDAATTPADRFAEVTMPPLATPADQPTPADNAVPAAGKTSLEHPANGGPVAKPPAAAEIDRVAKNRTAAAPATPAESVKKTQAIETATIEPVPPTVAGAADDAGWLRVEPGSLSREIDARVENDRAGQLAPGNALFNRVVLPSELPDDIRKDLPSVSFSGHLYSSNPKSSLVFIGNGRPVITGQAIERGLILHEITPGGVVVKFRGYLIEVGVLQNWTLN